MHEYQALLHRIAAEGIQSTISVKPTHVGLDFGEDFCFGQLRSIVEVAHDLGLTVEVDIEGSAYTQATVDVFDRLMDEYQEPAPGAAGVPLSHRGRPRGD